LNEWLEIEKGESVMGSPFCSDHVLCNSLPIFFHPFHDESTNSWLYRLASANCLNPEDFFYDKFDQHSGESIWSVDLFIPNIMGRSISKDQFNAGLKLPKAMTDGLLNSSIAIRTPKCRYCPDCLRDAPFFYIKREWEYYWNTFCPIHQTYLSNDCWSCGRSPTSFFYKYGSLERSDWKAPWGICKYCDKSLVGGASHHATPIDLAMVDSLWSKIHQTNQLIEQVHLGTGNDLKVSLALQLADVLIECHPIDQRELNAFLLNYGIDINKYIYPYSPDLNMDSGAVTNIPPESAIVLAWHIIENRWDVYDQFLNQCWLTRVHSNPGSGKRTV